MSPASKACARNSSAKTNNHICLPRFSHEAYCYCPCRPLLAGCDAIFNPVNDYKQTCFGNFTNECEDMLVDANLFLIEKFIEDVESKEDDLTALYGAEGYASIFKLTDYLVAKQEELRPGFFARNFFGEAQPFRGPRNALMSGAEFRAIEEAVEERFGKKNSAPVAEESAPDPEIAPEAEYQAEPEPEPQPVEEPADPSTADAGASTLEEAIAQYVEQDPDRNGGAEYLDARSTIEADFTGEGMPDVAVLYTIEGLAAPIRPSRNWPCSKACPMVAIGR